MKMLLVNNLEPEDIEFNRPLYESLSQFAEVDTAHYYELLSAELINKEYAGVVISGAPLHYDADVLTMRLAHLQWVKEVAVPVLGICLGHQNIALLHGARMIVDEEAENGEENLIIKQPDELLDGIDRVHAMHGCSVSLPEGFVLLASTRQCANQAMRHAQKPLYSVQFHPERSDSGIKVLENFVRIVESGAAVPGR